MKKKQPITFNVDSIFWVALSFSILLIEYILFSGSEIPIIFFIFNLISIKKKDRSVSIFYANIL